LLTEALPFLAAGSGTGYGFAFGAAFFYGVVAGLFFPTILSEAPPSPKSFFLLYCSFSLSYFIFCC